MRDTLSRLSCALVLSMLAVQGAFGQVVLDEFPSDMQLYGRVGDERFVTVPISGTVNSAAGITSLSAQLLVGSQSIDVASTQLTFVDGEAHFSMSLDLPVTRSNHRFELRNGATDVLLASASSVVAGDVYVVNGQSNALAGFSIESVDRDPFIRGYKPISSGTSPGWTSIQNVPCGMWMGRAANALTNEFDLPIAVFNFAQGGQRLRYFQPGASSQNFETVFETLREAGVREQVKGFLWSQGEADGFGSSIKDYRTRLTSFFNACLDSLPLVDEVYLWQVRAFSCSGQSPNVMEVQRRMNDELPYVTMLSTVNVEGHPDSCHFPYTNGREILGNWMADLLRVKQYGASKTGYLSPTLDSARVTGPQKITLYFDLKGASRLATTGSPWVDFQAEGLDIRAIGGSVAGNTVDLLFSSDISDAEGVSYFTHLGTTMDYLHTDLGLGVVTFFNESLVPGDGAAGSISDANLRMEANVSAIDVGDDVDVEITLTNQGSLSLRETEVQIPLPAALRYGDGRATELSAGEYDESIHVWLVPFVRPGEQETLTITYRVLNAAQPIPVWAQVVHSEFGELDSQPLNGTSGEIHEDDEARVVLGNPSQDCSFSAGLASSECTADSLMYWKIGFESEGLQSGAEVSFDFTPREAFNWQSLSEEQISLSFDTLTAREALPLSISIAQNGDETCERSFSLSPPNSCMVSPPDSMSNTSVTTPLRELKFSPNPVVSGGSVVLSSSEDLNGERATLMDAAGREVYSVVMAPQQREVRLPTLPAGLYVFRIGQSIGKVLIY